MLTVAVRLIYEQLENYEKIGHGMECTVYNIGDGVCYKHYKNHFRVGEIYERAKIAAENGLGPDVCESDEEGYFTEMVQMISDEFEYEYLYDQRGKLRRDLQNLFNNNDIFDLHWDNIGIKNGKLVCIDFGIGF